MPHPRRLRRPLRTCLASLAALVVVPLVVVSAAPAQAAVTGPTNGSTVSGKVAITEGRGATSNCITGGSPTSRLAVTRVADGALVHSASRSGTGSWSSTWDSLGQPRGQYRIQTWARDAQRSGFLNLGCTTQGETSLGSVTVTLDNRAAVDVTLPASVVTGETLPVSVRTTVVGTGVSGQALGGRTVTVSVPGVGSETVQTGADGRASTTFDLPDLPAGPLEVTAEVADDAAYDGRTGSATTTLTRRTSAVYYRGDSRAQPGGTARLEALVVDATPDSERFGEPLVGKPVLLAFDTDVAPAETVASGRAVRTVDVRGASRVLPVAAAFEGDDVWLPSGDGISFYVGDQASTPATYQSGPAGSLTTAVSGLLGHLLGTVVDIVDHTIPGLTQVTRATRLDALLGSLLGPVRHVVRHAGDPVDDTLGTILRRLSRTTPLGTIIETAKFRWRAVVVLPDGSTRAREFTSSIGVPQPLDVTGDGRADVLANVTLAEVSASSVVPRLEVARVGEVSALLPLSLQAVFDLPGTTDTYRFGYDARESDAPRSFAADIVLGDGGAALEVASQGDDALTVSGAIVPASASTPAPEQRFGVDFSAAPRDARIGLDLASGDSSDIAVSLRTDEPTVVGLSLVDDSAGADVFVAEGELDAVDGEVAVVVSGSEESGLGADVTSAAGMDRLQLRARELSDGRTASDVRLVLTDVPRSVSFGLSADGAGELTSSGPVGVFEAGYSAGRQIALLDDPAYLRLLQDGENQSVAVRLPGFEGMALDLGDEMSLALTMAPTPLRALLNQDGRVFDARVEDAPRQLRLALADSGTISVEGSDPIGLVRLTAEDASGLLSGASNLDLRLVDVPRLLSVEVGDDGVTFGTGGEAIGLLEVFADDGTHRAVPGDGDGLLVENGPDSTAIAGRISGLRAIEASLGEQPDVLLDTVAGEVFTITMRETDGAGAVLSTVNATLDHLVPNMRLGLLDDGSGATRLVYSASEPTNRLAFDMGGLSGSISGPLPADLLVCMAGDEACLPDLGIDDPGLGSVRFAASEPTTLDLVDAEGGLQARNLRLQTLDLTGTVDTDNGGEVYLNTTELGGECGAAGCVHPIQGGRITASLGSAGLTFEPGNGFYANDAVTRLKVDKLFGQPIGLSGTGGTGVVHCVSATKVDVTVFDIPILGDITLSVKDAICNVDRS